MIPVILIHFGSLPDYLFRSINQLLKYSNEIVLITDADLTIPGVEVVNSSSYDERVNAFESVYIHMSTNEPNFEKICIKRWLILASYITKNNIDVCYYSDSDVMVYANVNDVYPKYQRYDAVYTLPHYQENKRWTASGCCSFWKRETLQGFSNFIIESYIGDRLENLKEKWLYHQKHNLLGGVCDMTLLYLFSKSINFFSLTKVIDGVTFDQNYTDSENYFIDEFDLDFDNNAERKVKRIIWKNGMPSALNKRTGEFVRFIALTEYSRFVGVNREVKLRTRIYRFVKHIESKLRTCFKKELNHGWFGDFSSWSLAKKECSGYDASNILSTVKDSVLKVRNGEAVYERDSVLFDEITYSPHLIEVFQSVVKNGKFHVVDFGGSLGSSYFQHRSLFQDLTDFKWAVVEQGHFVECGKNDIALDELKFYNTVDEALEEQSAHVLFLSSVVQYFEEPYNLIESLLKYNFEFIVLDRTAFIEGVKERITKQVVPEFIYKASYPAWFLNEQKLLNAFSKHYELVFDFPSSFDSDGMQEDGKRVYRKGFYFKRKLENA
jgi:putative methyltransferase (TIGR04325 family)